MPYLVAFSIIACVVVAGQLQNATATSTSTGLIVPLYIYPGASWDKLIQEKNDHPLVPIIAIINPDNGPGTKDPNYVTAVQKLQKAGITVLGYVYTKDTDITRIRNYMGDYKDWYNVNGIFLDAMSSTTGNETFYKHLSSYAKSIGLGYTVGNPGTDTLPTYVGTVDNIVIHDNLSTPTVSLFSGWHSNFTKSNFSIISYDIPRINATYIENITQYVQYLYVTDDTLPNPFNHLPSYLDTLLTMIDTANEKNQTTVPMTVNSVSTNGTLLNGFWVIVQSDKNHTSGFTPFSYSVIAGNQYYVTASNFGNYTFDHWDDGTTNNTRLVIPEKNMTLTAYYDAAGVKLENQTLPSNTTKLLVTQPQTTVPQQVLKPIPNEGSITVNILYTGGDRADYSLLNFKIYQDVNKTVYREIDSVPGNPFDIDSLPINHRYKIEVFANGMSSDIEYVNLEKTHGQVNMYLLPPGGMRPHVFYNDAYTPISGATVVVKSQDNRTWSTGSTDINGETLRFWLEPTSAKNNYFIIQVKIDQHMSYSYSPAFLYPGYAQDINVVTPWPPIINSLIAVKVYNEQSKLFSTTDGNLEVKALDDSNKTIAESKVNPRGEADFGDLKVGDYVFRAMDQNGTIYGETNATIDGTKTNFTIFGK